MKKLLFIPLVIILIAGTCLSITGCGEEGPEPGSVLRVSMPTFAYETMDQIDGESFFGWSMYDPIITWDEDMKFVPALAEDWSLSEDGLTWTFNVRDDVFFHNGDPVTSADFMFTVEHFQSESSMNPWSPYARYNFDSHYCPDADTYVYKTIEPEPPLEMVFASICVIPKDYIEANGWDYFQEHPIGSGPWEFVEFVSGDHITMTANADHWRTPPHFETLIQYVVPEESTQVAMLKRGEVDIITGITLDRAIELKDEGYRTIQPSVPVGSNVIMPGSWLTDGPTSDIRVRHALSYAIDREELCDTFWHGYAEPGGRFFHYPGMYGYDDDWEAEEYDLAMAQSLLADAGYPDAFDDPVIQIYVQVGTGYTPDLFQILQGYWTAAGIQTNINMVDAFEMLGLFFFGSLDGPNIGAIIPWVYGNNWPTNVYHSYNMYCPGGVHSTSNDEHARELYMKAVHDPDPEKCEEYFTEFSTYVHDELFINFGICLSYDLFVVSDEVGDFGWGEWMNIAMAYADISMK